VTRKAAAMTDRAQFTWIKKPPKTIDTTCTVTFSVPPVEPMQPIWYFKKYFTDDMITHIVQQTNLYAAQVGSNFLTDEKEIEQYLGMLMRMGIVHMPRYDLYWSNELRYVPTFQTSINLNKDPLPLAGETENPETRRRR
jgi:hypothetical protein